MNQIETTFSALANEQKPQALATVVQAVSPTAAKAGDKALLNREGIIEGWIGGGCAQPAVIAAAAEAIDSGETQLIRVAPKGEWASMEGVSDFHSGCLSGGTLVIFIEPLQQKTALVILGDSPVAKHLGALANETGFAVHRPDLAKELAALPPSRFIVIATQGRHDRAALKAALNSQAAYIFMVASDKKAKGLRNELVEKGFSGADLKRLKSPAGIDIGAESPAEIALAILADVVKHKYLKNTHNKTNDTDHSLQEGDHKPSQKPGGCCAG